MVVRTQVVCRASNLIGTLVKNPEAEDIGVIDAIVIELGDGDAAYAVLRLVSK